MSDPRYPVGKFTWPDKVTEQYRRTYIQQLEDAPAKLRAAVGGLDEKQLDTAYREGGWTVRQVVHHLADSHMNSYIRFKLALTESEPAIKTYDEKLWARLPDAATMPVEPSLTLFESLHKRFVAMLRAMKPEDFSRVVNHPELGRVTLEKYLPLYAWHARHHVAHITELRKAKGWN
jgi:uncharacterized damage-inducible protein DinB